MQKRAFIYAKTHYSEGTFVAASRENKAVILNFRYSKGSFRCSEQSLDNWHFQILPTAIIFFAAASSFWLPLFFKFSKSLLSLSLFLFFIIIIIISSFFISIFFFGNLAVAELVFAAARSYCLLCSAMLSYSALAMFCLLCSSLSLSALQFCSVLTTFGMP